MFLAWWKWFNVSSDGSDSIVSSGGSDSMFLVIEVIQCF